MLSYNKELNRLEMNHPGFANRSDVIRLKNVLALEKSRFKASRAVLRVLTDKPENDCGFALEARIRTTRGQLAFFGINDKGRWPERETIARERSYLSSVMVSKRKGVREGLEIRRLTPDAGTATELERLFSGIYTYYPQPLDGGFFFDRLKDSIAYAVIEDGKIAAALFGLISGYGDLPVVEFSLCATKGTRGGVDLTTALASRIKAEAMSRFYDPLMIAETIASPVMRSCHDLGMEVEGMMPEHFRIGIGKKTFTNLYIWSL